MQRTLRKAGALLAVFYAQMLTYRAELFLWALSGIMPFILMGLWAKASAETAMGMTPVEFVRYFFGVFITRQLTMVWVVYEFEQDVVRGRLSPYLLQPLNPLWRYLASHVGERLARLPFIAALTVLFFVLYPKAFWVPSVSDAAAVVVALTAAFALRFIMQYTFAMLAFWTERANAIEDLWFALYLFLSGYIAPLDVFPDAARRIAAVTPFPYMVYMPAKLMTSGDASGLGTGLTVMALWAGGFLLIQRLLWRLGLRRYTAMGA